MQKQKLYWLHRKFAALTEELVNHASPVKELRPAIGPADRIKLPCSTAVKPAACVVLAPKIVRFQRVESLCDTGVPTLLTNLTNSLPHASGA